MPQPPKPGLHTQIRDLIFSSFSLEEFRTLCADLGVPYDDLPGEGLSARIRELILRLDRAQRLDDLLNFCAHLRPKLTWPDLAVTPVTLDAAPVQPTLPQRNPRLIFISHARQDAEFAHQLADDLIARGWDIWIAPDSIRPGEKWVDAINRGLAESGILLLALTPYAVNSTWVHSETNVAIGLQHRNAIRFIPLDVAPVATPPPLWQAYQWIPFQNSYKDGLERLMQELQPEQMAPLADWYRQMQQAMGRNDWALAQKLGEQIKASYPDYRETEARLALARREVEREQANQIEAAGLYPRLKMAVDRADWANAIALADQIDGLVPNYQGVAQLRDHTRLGQHQEQNQQQQKQGQNPEGQRRSFSRWGFGGGVVIILLLGMVALWSQTIDNDTVNTLAPNRTPPSVTNVPPETLQPSNAKLGDHWTRPDDGMVMVYVPGGVFQMGSDPNVDGNAQNDEQPQHEVTLSSFWIDRTEVTNTMYERCVASSDCAESSYANDDNYNGDDYPVVGVSWNDVNNYCEWVGGQLPTEAQWEYAARGNDRRLYPWGDESPTCALAQFSGCDGDTVPVGSFPDGNSWVGVADMAGNVWEWVADWYDSDYYELLRPNDPTGRASGDYKVLRGGSLGVNPVDLRVANRNSGLPDLHAGSFGFRCVISLDN